MAIVTYKLYAVTIFGYRKDGMSEQDYHDYISQTYAGHLKALIAQNDIMSYNMQHNTTDTQPLFDRIHGGHVPQTSVTDCDAVIQIVFRDIVDYLRVRRDPYLANVVNPDHVNFADPKRTRFAAQWLEYHVQDGKVIS